MAKLFEAISGVSNQWSLAAFAIAAVVLILARRRGKIPAAIWGVVAAIAILGLAPTLASVYLERARLGHASEAIYRVRVTVLDPRGTPVEDARVWSSLGGEAKKVAGGWQFDIPAASRPADGKLTVYAGRPAAFAAGRSEVMLEADYNPAVLLQLAAAASATVRGVVVDVNGRALPGARVSISGYGEEAVVTGAGGDFVLPAHAADGQQVQLRAQRDGYAPATLFHPAGKEPATIILDRN